MCSHEIIPPLLLLLSCFSPLDPILHLAPQAWLSHSVSMTSHWLLYLLQWCLSLGLDPFPWLSIPGELQVSSVELSTPAPPLSLPGWIGAEQHPPVWTKLSEVASKPYRACPQEGTSLASLKEPFLLSLARQALSWTCHLCQGEQQWTCLSRFPGSSLPWSVHGDFLQQQVLSSWLFPS